MTLTTRIAVAEILASGVGTPRRLLFTVEIANRGAEPVTGVVATATAWVSADGVEHGPADGIATAVHEELDVVDAGEIDHVEYEVPAFGQIDTTNGATVRIRVTLDYKNAAGARQQQVVWHGGPEGFAGFGGNFRKIAAPE